MNIRFSSFPAASRWLSGLSLNQEIDYKGIPKRTHLSSSYVCTTLNHCCYQFLSTNPARGGPRQRAQEQVVKNITDLCASPSPAPPTKTPWDQPPNPTLTNNPLSLHSQASGLGMSWGGGPQSVTPPFTPTLCVLSC